MQKDQILQIHRSQKEFFKTHKTKDYKFRLNQLNKLKEAIIKNEEDIILALKNDLGKCRFESYVGEVSFILKEIDLFSKKLSSWMKDVRVSSPALHLPARSWIKYEPLGQTLIIAPWNYPFQLLLSPLLGAIAAGNTAILKPSEVAPNVSRIIAKLIAEIYSKDYIAVIEGAVEETTILLDQKFDFIFYTGNEFVAKIIMAKAAKHLTPVVLELGGKSPCIVLKDCDLSVTAKRIVWGKFFNAGQTCVAPDYLLVEKQCSEELLIQLVKEIKNFYSANTIDSPDYGRIVNKKHFQRVSSLIENEFVVHGGDTNENELFIGPTILKAPLNEAFNLQVMREEIFGPVLPIFEIESLEQGIDFINKGEKPLASYLYSKSIKSEKMFLDKVSSGGVSLNDCIIHLSNEKLPFGGVGNSGMGAYHGKFSFEAFSHKKAVMKRYFFFDIPLRYPPYAKKYGLIRWLLNLF